MLRVLLSVVLLFSVSSVLTGQTVTQTPAQSSAQAPSAPPAAAPVPTTIQTSTQIVVVDVVVTDKDHKPVTGLTASDFSLNDSGIPQKILAFEDHSAPVAAPKPLPKLPAGIYTNYAPIPEGAPVNVLLLDTLNTPLTDQQYLHAQVTKYLQTATPGTRLAIFVLSQKLNMLQGFTTDIALLQKMLNEPKSQRDASLLSDDLADQISTYANDPTLAETVQNLEQFDTLAQSFQTELRVQYTLDGLNSLARYLSGIPGRKNLIWFSGAFPLVLMPNQDLQNPFMSEANFAEQFYETAGLLERSRVAVYPVDARGLATAPPPTFKPGTKPGQPPRIDTSFNDNMADTHITMGKLAEATGGQPFYNTNGLKEAVDSAVAQGSSFYTLTYRPSAINGADAEHAISVKLEKAGYTLAYRHSYIRESVTPRRHLAAPADLAAQRAANAAPEPHLVQLALKHGAPGPTQIVFDAGIAPIADPASDKLLRGNFGDPELKGPFQTVSVTTICAGSNITMAPQPDGRAEVRMRFIVMLYTPDGKLMNRTSSTLNSMLSPESISMIRAQGVRLHQEISVPAKGDYSVRIAIEDLANEAVGALEIPISVVRKTTPLQRQPAEAPAASPAKTDTTAPPQ